MPLPDKTLATDLAEFRLEMRQGFAELKEMITDLANRVGVVETRDADVVRKNGKDRD